MEDQRDGKVPRENKGPTLEDTTDAKRKPHTEGEPHKQPKRSKIEDADNVQTDAGQTRSPPSQKVKLRSKIPKSIREE